MWKVNILLLIVVSFFLTANKGCQFYPAFLSQTGQTTPYATGDDGDLQRGISLPEPRFKDNQDGTVTDYLTGLVWLKHANCFDLRPWDDAVFECNQLADGSCGLSDGSVAGDWSLPNANELLSLMNYKYYNPAISNTAGTGQLTEGDPFVAVQNHPYWSSTTWAGPPADYSAYPVFFGGLGFGSEDNVKTNLMGVWCVRDSL